MAHIEDRWFKTITGSDNKKRRVKTTLYGKGLRYRVRYIDPNGIERAKSFPDKQKHEAEDFLIGTENAKRAGTYLDPGAGNIGFTEYAYTWLRSRDIDPSTREAHRLRIANHLAPYFGNRALRLIRPEMINEWNLHLTPVYAEDTRAVSFVVLKSIFASAVDNRRIQTNPCAAKTVNAPKQRPKPIIPWPRAHVLAVRQALPERYKAMVDVGAGCGNRQGEILGLASPDFDFDRQMLDVRRQVKRVRGRLVFGLPKNDKERSVPLPRSVADAARQHMKCFPPVMVTLPWEDPDSDVLVTAPLIFTNGRGTAISGYAFSNDHWSKALAHAGIPRKRENGMHALRHYYASVLIDAGESIKVVSVNLGHKDPAFTWRTYVHLVPGSETRTRSAIDRLAAEDQPDDGLQTA